MEKEEYSGSGNQKGEFIKCFSKRTMPADLPLKSESRDATAVELSCRVRTRMSPVMYLRRNSTLMMRHFVKDAIS